MRMQLRFPAIGDVVSAALHTARRFPFVLATAAIATYAAIELEKHPGNDQNFTRLLATATLGVPLLFALTLVAERRVRSAAIQWLLPAAGVGALLAFWSAWPQWPSALQWLRYAQLSVAFHLLVAFLPYLGFDEPNGFWQYNKALFLRILTSVLYSAVLYVGLAVALLALDKLLGITLPGGSYAKLWFVIVFTFNTWFFLAGVPNDFAALGTRTDYPAGLRIITQYVLIPIVTIYLVILTLELGKVLLTRVWPSGWIGYLVTSAAGVGMLSWLLVYPLETREGYAWVRTFTKGFYIALMPSIVMLWMALWKRVAEYGITEPRYFPIVFSVWLAAIALYYTTSRSRNIKVIPASLCALALLTFAGPWGAYTVSRTSQVNRLQRLLVRNELLQNGHLHPATHDVSFADEREISSGFHYLLETHGSSSVASWLTDSIRPAAHSGASPDTGVLDNATQVRTQQIVSNVPSDAATIMHRLNLEYVEPGNTSPDVYYGTFNAAPLPPIAIGGYSYAIQMSVQSLRDSLRIVDGTYLKLSTDTTALRITRDGVPILEIPLQEALDSAVARERHPRPSDSNFALHIEAKNGDVTALVYIMEMSYRQNRHEIPRATWLQGELFLKLSK
jgi:Domain of unknown function (DUF4153)